MFLIIVTSVEKARGRNVLKIYINATVMGEIATNLVEVKKLVL